MTRPVSIVIVLALAGLTAWLLPFCREQRHIFFKHNLTYFMILDHLFRRATETFSGLDLAMKDCNRAIQLDPEGLPGAYSFRANLHIAHGDYHQAI